MKYSGDIRVKTDQKYRSLYTDMRNFAIGDMHELFFICACLGYRANKRKTLGNQGEDRFWSRTITPEEYACYYSMVLDSNNMDISFIKDDKSVISEIEQYANAGMEILINDLLSDYLIKGKDDLKLDSTMSRELPKILLYHIYERTAVIEGPNEADIASRTTL